MMPEIFLKLDYLNHIKPSLEVCSFLKVQEVISHTYQCLNVITDIVIPPQTVSAGMADPDINWMPPEGFILWHHSHHTMSPSPSGEDTKTIEKRTKENHKGMTYGLITSHKKNFTLRAGISYDGNYAIFDNCELYLYNLDAELSDFEYKHWSTLLSLMDIALSDADKSFLDAEYERNVKSHVYTPIIAPSSSRYWNPEDYNKQIALLDANVQSGKLGTKRGNKSKKKDDESSLYPEWDELLEDTPFDDIPGIDERYGRCESCNLSTIISQGHLNFMLCDDCNEAIESQAEVDNRAVKGTYYYE